MLSARYGIEREEHWCDYVHTMPYIPLRLGWSFSVYPPFNGAMFRFSLQYESYSYSIYFDAHNALGIMDEPYYEVYPVNENNYRSSNIYDILREIYVDAEGIDIIRNDYPEWFV